MQTSAMHEELSPPLLPAYRFALAPYKKRNRSFGIIAGVIETFVADIVTKV
jgi:hypothetical protein